ncbi:MULTISPECIES: hypothetical protein [Streptomyces]|jgi:hypothetical protein|uniref:Uncharacterized protein n=1 Tax=Streptomyces sp. 900129855 TaxID=3155129 RepID=A0ABV2ZHZ4_9ACTN
MIIENGPVSSPYGGPLHIATKQVDEDTPAAMLLTDDRTTAYVRTSDGVEAWPPAKDVVACA